jgi:uncharacterized protein
MASAGTVDLSDADVVDDHCHAFRVDELLARDPKGFEARLTLMGMCAMSAAETDPGLWTGAEEMVESTVYSLVARRWMAERLSCDATAAAVARARDETLRREPVAYIHALLDDEHLTGLVTDEGFPLPRIPSAEFEGDVGGVPVHRVVRIEPLIAELRESATSYRNLEERFEGALEEAADDSRTVAFKSIVAYRTGLDVEPTDGATASWAFEAWRRGGWPEARTLAKPVRDRLLERTLAVAKRRELVAHIHCGDGDPDIDLAHARPHDLFPFLRAHVDQPIVLIHGGHPWTQVAGYIASLLPNVYVDLSVLVPWASSGIDQALEHLIGMVPTSKLLYASDQASEPEVFWLSARLARRALERVLGDLVDRDFVTASQAQGIGRGILADNTRRLHGLSG